MKIFIKVKTGVKKAAIQKLDNTHFVASVCEEPREGRANEAIIKAMAEYFARFAQ